MQEWEEKVYLKAEGRAEGRAEGKAEGLKQGIKVLIQTCRELGISREDTVIRVQEKFALHEDDAETYLAEYWKNE